MTIATHRRSNRSMISQADVLASDLNGFIIDRGSLASHIIADTFGVNVPPEHCKSCLIEKYGIPKKDYQELVASQLLNHRDFLTYARLFPQFKEAHETLSNMNWKYITSRTPQELSPVFALFAREKIPLKREDIIATSHQDKGPALFGLRAKYYVDDDPDKLAAVSDYFFALGAPAPELVYFKTSAQPYVLPEGTSVVSKWDGRDGLVGLIEKN